LDPTAIQTSVFGRSGDGEVQLHVLSRPGGLQVGIISYGAAIAFLRTPDRTGRVESIVLGFDRLEPYLAGTCFLGATVGRYANRIAGGRFAIDGAVHQLARNDGANTLHGGPRGFHTRNWSSVPFQTPEGPGVRLTHLSADGEEGFPGAVTAQVAYQLLDGALAIAFEATTTAPTPVSLANHAYFNLSGDPRRSVLDHLLTVRADRFTPVDSSLIPTGELRPVDGTPFDFRQAVAIGARIGEDDDQLRLGRGYDHNWALDKPSPGALATAAVLADPGSGRVLEVRTTQPGLQVYSGNFLDAAATMFGHRTGLCLETQHFPDSPNQPHFPSAILRPGEVYRERTILAFGVSPD
jgi:aldose 1-epimerase